jgi:hypothetical protein
VGTGVSCQRRWSAEQRCCRYVVHLIRGSVLHRIPAELIRTCAGAWRLNRCAHACHTRIGHMTRLARFAHNPMLLQSADRGARGALAVVEGQDARDSLHAGRTICLLSTDNLTPLAITGARMERITGTITAIERASRTVVIEIPQSEVYNGTKTLQYHASPVADSLCGVCHPGGDLY